MSPDVVHLHLHEVLHMKPDAVMFQHVLHMSGREQSRQ